MTGVGSLLSGTEVVRAEILRFFVVMVGTYRVSR